MFSRRLGFILWAMGVVVLERGECRVVGVLGLVYGI